MSLGHEAAGRSAGCAVVIEGTGAPDLEAVEVLAHWILAVRRAGRRPVVDYLAPELARLLDLAGLPDLARLGVEVQGKTEGGEEAEGLQGVEEEGQLGDLPA